MGLAILFLYSATQDSVRIQKIADYLYYDQNATLSFWGWNRYKGKRYTDSKFSKISYLLTGGGEGSKILPLLYVWFLIRLFFKLLFSKEIEKKTIIYTINFETAFITWVVSRIRHLHFIYDIWDEFAISHRFPKYVVRLIKRIDSRVRKASDLYIHVDANRYSEIDEGNKNSIIIYNSPFDYLKGKEEEVLYDNSLAVTGWLNTTRGLYSILQFAKNNPDVRIIIVGEFIDKSIYEEFARLNNVDYHHFMPQNDLFSLIKNVRGIFSLYDPSIEINRLAASNKLYDAMMLSIPVIVNEGILAASMVSKRNIGYIVNYQFDKSWDLLSEVNYHDIKVKGRNGRKLYLQEYEFKSQMDRVFMPALQKVQEKIDFAKQVFR